MTSESKDASDNANPAEPTTDAFTTPELTDRSHGTSINNQDLPPEIQVDEKANKEMTRRRGRGYQVYDCPPPPGFTATWHFREPLADLYDLRTEKRCGIHFAGPNWEDADGSRVTGGKPVAHDSPDDPEEDVPWLLVSAASHPFGFKGVFSNVTFIQRVLTEGGAPPPSCEANSGATLKCRTRRFTSFGRKK